MGKFKNFLIQKLRTKFKFRIFARGKAYYEGNHVANIEADGNVKNIISMHGEVEGTKYYFCGFDFDLERSEFKNLDCDCPYDSNCKHLAALGLKFIDLYEEFREKARINSNNIELLKNDLMFYINNGGLMQTRKEENYGYEKLLKDYPKNAVEGEFEEINNKKLLKQTFEKIGIKPENVSSDIFKLLEKEICKNKTEKIEYIPFRRVKSSCKFQPEKYRIVVNCDYSFQASIYKNNDKYDIISPSELLNGNFNLTQEQKEFFEFLKKYNASDWEERQNIDYGKFFLLAKKTGISVFKKDFYYSNKKINIVDNPDKIKASLVLSKNENSYYEEHNFIFKLDEEYRLKRYNDNNKRFVSAGEHCVYINGLDALAHKIPKNFVKIISRIIEKNQSCMDPVVEIKLTVDEIIDLNKIIEDGKKYFDLQTELEPSYNIKKFDQSKPCILVDFDEKEAFLEIKPVIDYGFTRQNVADTVYYARMKAGNDFKRREHRNQKTYIMHIDDKNIYYAPLEEKKEINLYKQFYSNENNGFSKALKCKRKGEEAIYLFLEQNWPHLNKTAQKNNYEIIFEKDEFNFSFGDFRADFEVDLNADNDWLWFDASCYCGEDKICLDDLKKYAKDKKGFLKTADGKIIKITNFEDLERFIMMLESFYARENGGFEGKLYHATELEYVFTSSKYYNAKLEESFKSFIKEAQKGKPVEKVNVPAKFNKILRSYQKEGIDWFYFLRKYHFAGILADDMGLGKTLQALVLLEMEKIKGKPSVVVCPKTILYNWKLEAEKFTPDLKTLIIDGSPDERIKQIKNVKKYDLIITGYATMKKDNEAYKEQKIKFNYCVLDEAQFIKNHATKNAQIVKKIDASYRLALTGTPLENSVSEIWSIFDFLMPGFLGSNSAFVKRFEKPIMKENSAAALENLRKKIECFMLRRTKKEVLKELPPKIEQISVCHLEPAQNILYQEILANVKKDVFKTVKDKGFNKSQIHILAGITKLRQVCNHPALLLKEKKYSKYESAKLNMFLELLDEIMGNNRKVLVFSQFTMMLDILAEELKKNKIGYNYLSGKTNKRQELVKDFNENEDKKVFLISLKAGGTGLNLTSADNVIIFDPWWNPSVENQAVDRTYRIGQKNSVNVYRLITAGTIEEKILKFKEKKKFLFDNLVGESKNLFSKLTWEELKDLFK